MCILYTIIGIMKKRNPGYQEMGKYQLALQTSPLSTVATKNIANDSPNRHWRWTMALYNGDKI